MAGRDVSCVPKVPALRFPFSSRIKREGLTIKPGPTESGEVATTTTSRPPTPVGGEMLPVDKLSVFLSQYWILIVVFLVPLMLLLYMKRNVALKLLSPIIPKLLGLR